jgi:mono/diheme cytochrome c family protein
MPIAPKRCKLLLAAMSATVLMFGASNNLSAAELGDVQAGERFARETCASCHAIEKGAKASPDADAPTFQAVANTPGLNRRALIVFFRTPHKNMPNLIVKGDEADDVIAYILSLKAGE